MAHLQVGILSSPYLTVGADSLLTTTTIVVFRAIYLGIAELQEHIVFSYPNTIATTMVDILALSHF
jgi:hypothetical protein